MANSSQYYNWYKQERDKADNYSKNINELQNIKNALSNNFNDEQSNVNGEFEDLKGDMNNAVRHDVSFDIIVNECYSHKEKGTTADTYLSGAITDLENEIASLNSKRSTAESNRDYNYRKYKEKKEEERQAFLDSLNIFG